MITRFPILELLSKKQGSYVSADQQHRVELNACGYGFTLEATGNTKRGQLSGVIGVSGRDLELHALVGFPSVISFRWSHEFRELSDAPEVEIRLHSTDLNASVVLLFGEATLRFGLVTGQQPEALHELRRA